MLAWKSISQSISTSPWANQHDHWDTADVEIAHTLLTFIWMGTFFTGIAMAACTTRQLYKQTEIQNQIEYRPIPFNKGNKTIVYFCWANKVTKYV